MANMDEADPLQQVISSLNNVNISLNDINKVLSEKKETYSAKEIPATSVKDMQPQAQEASAPAGEVSAVTDKNITSKQADNKESATSLNVLTEDSVAPANKPEDSAEPGLPKLDLQPADTTFNLDTKKSLDILKEEVDKLTPTQRSDSSSSVASNTSEQNNIILSSNSDSKSEVPSTAATPAQLPDVTAESMPPASESYNNKMVEVPASAKEPSTDSFNKMVEVPASAKEPSTDSFKPKTPGGIDQPSQNNFVAKQEMPIAVEPQSSNNVTDNFNTQEQTLPVEQKNAPGLQPPQIQKNYFIAKENVETPKETKAKNNNTLNSAQPASNANAIQSEPVAADYASTSQDNNATDKLAQEQKIPETFAEPANESKQTKPSKPQPPAFEIVEDTKNLPRESTKDNSMVMMEKSLNALNSVVTKSFASLVTQMTDLNNTVSEIYKLLPELRSTGGPSAPSMGARGDRESKPFNAGGGSINEFRSSTSKMFSPGRSDINPTI